MSDQMKTCSRCHESKIIHMDFYMCQGIYRSECKRCTIKKNTSYQKRTQPWKYRVVDEDKKQYRKEYYAANKEKFAAYRTTFNEKNPEYHKLYARKKYDKQ